MRRRAPSEEQLIFEGNEEAGTTAVDEADPPAGRRPADPWRTWFFVLLGVGIVAAAVWVLLGSRLLVVRHVQVTGSRVVSAADVRQVAAVPIGTPLADVNTGVIAARVEQLNAVAWAQVSRSWPDTIVITVHRRVPVLAVASAGRYGLIDGSGVTVRWVSRKPAGMPLLTAPAGVLRGSPGVRSAATVLTELPPWLRSRVRSVAASAADAVTLRLAGRVTVLWGGTGQLRLKVAELSKLMRYHARFYDISDPSTAVTQG